MYFLSINSFRCSGCVAGCRAAHPEEGAAVSTLLTGALQETSPAVTSVLWAHGGHRVPCASTLWGQSLAQGHAVRLRMGLLPSAAPLQDKTSGVASCRPRCRGCAPVIALQEEESFGSASLAWPNPCCKARGPANLCARECSVCMWREKALDLIDPSPIPPLPLQLLYGPDVTVPLDHGGPTPSGSTWQLAEPWA